MLAQVDREILWDRILQRLKLEPERKKYNEVRGFPMAPAASDVMDESPFRFPSFAIAIATGQARMDGRNPWVL